MNEFHSTLIFRGFAEFIHRALCHSQARGLRQRVFVFQNSLFAVRQGEELWMRMNTGAEQQGEGMIGNKKLTYLRAESVCGESLVTGGGLMPEGKLILDVGIWIGA